MGQARGGGSAAGVGVAETVTVTVSLGVTELASEAPSVELAESLAAPHPERTTTSPMNAAVVGWVVRTLASFAGPLGAIALKVPLTG